MKFSSIANLDKRSHADILVLPYWKGKQHAEPAGDFKKIKSLISGPIETQDFKGRDGEFLIIYTPDQKENRIALLGLGEKEDITMEKLRRSYASALKGCHARKCKEINILLPIIPSFPEDLLIRGVSEGLLLPNYHFDKLKNHALKENPTILVGKANLIGCSKNGLAQAEKYATISQAVYFTRDLVNGNADDVTPKYLAEVAQGLAKKYSHVKTTVFDKKRIEKEKMGLILAVNRGSSRDPSFVIIEYKGDPKSHDNTVVVGKGITYDTGGLNLKAGTGMETMKCDMGGAAVCLGTVMAAASLGLKVNLTAVFAATENSIGSNSFKPGDVYKGYSGKTVEIGNTDAEGRLILADTLAYVCDKLKPSRIIDFATLTGGIEIALGSEASGLFSNNDALADTLIRSGSETFERVWRFPLYDEYRDLLKSDVADIRNIGGRPASSISASLFLKEFIDKTPWAHLDIAGTAFLSDNKRYNPKFATGVGVRLMINFLENSK